MTYRPFNTDRPALRQLLGGIATADTEGDRRGYLSSTSMHERPTAAASAITLQRWCTLQNWLKAAPA